MPYGANGSLSANGEWLAYTPISRDTRTWKRYMGGMAADIWLYARARTLPSESRTGEARTLCRCGGGPNLYYLSDAGLEHRLNLWRWNPRNGETSQLTHYEDFDLKWPSTGPGLEGEGEIIFQHGPTLKVLNLGSGQISELSIQIPGDAGAVRSQRIDAADFFQNSIRVVHRQARSRRGPWRALDPPRREGFPPRR